jgi:thiamine-phosphate pyrophosphorylase
VRAIADSPACRLYLTTPPELVSGGVLMRDFLQHFESAIAASDVASLLIAAPDTAGDDALAAVAGPLIRIAQGQGIAVLLPGRAGLAKSLGADGVHLDLRAAAASDLQRLTREARAASAPDAIVGVLSPPERDAAMDAAEAGADYIGFDLAAEECDALIRWWGEVMTVACVAFGRIDPAMATALAQDRADFIAPDPELWSRADPAGEIAALASAIRAG